MSAVPVFEETLDDGARSYLELSLSFESRRWLAETVTEWWYNRLDVFSLTLRMHALLVPYAAFDLLSGLNNIFRLRGVLPRLHCALNNDQDDFVAVISPTGSRIAVLSRDPSLSPLSWAFSTEDLNQQDPVAVSALLSTQTAKWAIQLLHIELKLRYGGTHRQERKQCLKLLHHLVQKFGTLPPSLYLRNVTRDGHHPIRGGSYADIFRGYVKTNQIEGGLESTVVCLKVLRTFQIYDEEEHKKILKEFCNEAFLWTHLEHPNIVPCFGVSTNALENRLSLISPWMSNGNVMEFLHRNPQHDRLAAILDISSGLAYLHGLEPQIVHGDVKGVNILVTENHRCCLADFGLGLMMETHTMGATGSTSSVKGTTRWSAPELFRPADEGRSPLKSARDIYAYACTVLEIYTGRPPFSDPKISDMAVILQVIGGKRPSRPQEMRHASLDDVWKILEECWAEDSHSRPLVRDIIGRLEYKFQPTSSSSIRPHTSLVNSSNTADPDTNDPSTLRPLKTEARKRRPLPAIPLPTSSATSSSNIASPKPPLPAIPLTTSNATSSSNVASPKPLLPPRGSSEDRQSPLTRIVTLDERRDSVERRLDEERLQIEAERREREEQHLFLTVKVITDDTFSRHDGFDLATFDDRNWPRSDLPSFRVLKQEPYSVFKARVAQHFNYPESQIRLWVLMNRLNKTVRPDTAIPENEPTLTVEMIWINMTARQTKLRLYLDVIADPSRPHPPLNSIMMFLKHFDTSKQTLVGVGKVYVSKTSEVGDLVSIINERMRWTPGTLLKLYEEIKPGMILLMKPKLSFAQCEIQDGDVICFQVDLTEKESHDIESQGLYSNPISFYDFLQNRVMISFRPKFDDVSQENPEFILVLSKKQNYDIMSAKVGATLRHDPIKLRFTTTHPANGSPKSVVRRSRNQTIADIIAPYYSTSEAILYERLDLSIIELETKRSLKVIWTGIHNKEEATHPFLLPKTSSVHDLADHLAKQVTLTPSGTGKIRIFEISKDGKTQKEFTGSEMIGNVPDPVELYGEEILREELEADDLDKVVGVFHFDKTSEKTHGIPFKFVVKTGEKFVDTKKRLQARLGVSDKGIAKYKFALIRVSMFKQLSYIEAYIEDEDSIYDHRFAPEDVLDYMLGLDHMDGGGRTQPEQGIVIR